MLTLNSVASLFCNYLLLEERFAGLERLFVDLERSGLRRLEKTRVEQPLDRLKGQTPLTRGRGLFVSSAPRLRQFAF